MQSTFRLTPDVKSNLVQLAFRGPDGAIEPLAGQLPIIEQDPEKSKFSF